MLFHLLATSISRTITNYTIQGCELLWWVMAKFDQKWYFLKMTIYHRNVKDNHIWYNWIQFPYWKLSSMTTLQWRHNEHDGISNHQPRDCLLNHLFRRKSQKTSKLHVTGFCAGNSLVMGEFPTQMASNAENISIWWCHHVNIEDDPD